VNTIIDFGFHKNGRFLGPLSDYQLIEKNTDIELIFNCTVL
jgi:hypothetical protein